MSSDNIQLLTYTSNLGPLATHYTEKVIAGQYITICIIVKSDVPLQVIVQFSGDGIYWDYNITTNIDANTNKSINATIQGKWVRLAIKNLDTLLTSSFLRVNTYGTPSNATVLAQLASNGNINPVVDIGNLPTDYDQKSVLKQYRFNFGSSGTTSGIGGGSTPFYTTNRQIQYAYNPFKGDHSFDFNNSMLNIRSGLNENTSLITDSPTLVNCDYFIVTFSFLLTNTTNSNSGSIAIGVRDSVSSYITFIQNSGSSGYNKWGVSHYNGYSTETVLRQNFNVDTCDGTSKIPIIDFTKLQTVKFVISQSGFKFFIKYNEDYVLAHTYVPTDRTHGMFVDKSYGFHMSNNTLPATSGTLDISCSSWMMQSLIDTPMTLSNYNYYNSGILSWLIGGLYHLLTLYNGTTYQGSPCFRNIKITKLTFTGHNTNDYIFTVYIGSTITGGTFSTVDTNSNLQASTVGSLSSSGYLIYHTYIVGGMRQGVVDLDIELNPLQSLTIMGSGTGGSSYITDISFYFW